eukprot:jgi/Ulvmu1/10014/UM059_0063.1
MRCFSECSAPMLRVVINAGLLGVALVSTCGAQPTSAFVSDGSGSGSNSPLSGQLEDVFDPSQNGAEPAPEFDQPDQEEDGTNTIAAFLDKHLEQEFRNEELASQSKTDLNETLSKEKGSHLEQVVKVSRSSKPKVNNTEEAMHTDMGPSSASDEDQMHLEEDYESPEDTNVEQDVDRLIDADNNEYVLSRSKAGVALTLDPLLIQDLTVVLTTSSVFGILFEAIKQPTLNGYILAGSLVGPDGLALVKELVQVESLAQVGVQLLLFGLGMEFNIEKLRTVGSVAILGGLIQIGLFIAISAIGALLIGGAAADGIFVGALVSMSSTSVVVKMLGDRGNSAVSQIVIGTLILQDCSVGLMFALMPVLATLRDPSSGLDPEAFGEIVLLILKVLFKLVLTLAATAALSRGLVPQMIMYVKKKYSDELFQMSMVAYCMTCAWCCGKLGLSHELGAFLAGIMVGTMHQHEDVLHATVQVRNVFTGLFLASIGLVISPVFIFEHIRLLSIGAVFVLLVKGLLISVVVYYFGYSWNTALAVGFSLAQVGEFAFVLLSLASQLGLISNRLSMLLLGVTAISLLTTPLVLNMTVHVLNPDSHASILPSTSAPGGRKGAGEDHDPGGGTAVCEHFSSPMPEYDSRGMLTSRGARPASERFDPDLPETSPLAFTLGRPQTAISRCSSHGDANFYSPSQ